ncbi:hypothetical protein V493_01865 [Pseudogymnoascus sp. VKM F-4281 (FW-2241)]|nr:hypothetical protein V493_01865 [Pseudogymnoascus sp. VKM F-4281 (FW-2241)]
MHAQPSISKGLGLSCVRYCFRVDKIIDPCAVVKVYLTNAVSVGKLEGLRDFERCIYDQLPWRSLFHTSTKALDNPYYGRSNLHSVINENTCCCWGFCDLAIVWFFISKLAFTPGLLNKLINPKSLAAFYALGGLDGIVKGLRTDGHSGLSVEETFLDGTVSIENVKTTAIDSVKKGHRTMTGGSHSTKKGYGHDLFSDRKRVFQDNRLPEKKGKSIFELMWITYNDKVLILLSIAAVVSLAVGLYQSFGQKHEGEEPRIEWLEGVAIIVAIVIVVVVGSVNDYQKERQFAKLNEKKQDRYVKVIRSGKSREISVFDILVGDVVLLEPGDIVPVDGIFIDGHNVKCDESSATGESDIIKKRPASEVYEAIKSGQDTKKLDPFILSGAHVTEGVGRFVVTSTGVNSSYGKIMMSLREDPEVTPLQSKLHILAEYIAKLGGAAGLLLFVVLLIKFLAQLPHNSGTASEKGQQFLGIFIVTVTIIVVAVPEGLPLAVTLPLAFATTRMLKDNNLVRHLKACEVMGNATAICSDKTGTLTQNKMQVVAGTIGTSSRFGGTTEPNGGDDNMSGGDRHPPVVMDNIPAKEVASTLDEDVQGLLRGSIAINSTAFEGIVDGEQTFIGSKTETALLIFAKEQLGLGPVSEERSNASTLQFVPFDSGRKCMGVVISTGEGKARLLVKGASEILLDQCSCVIADPTRGVQDAEMTDENRKTLNGLITSYAKRSLRTIGLVYRDFEQWPPKDARRAKGESSEIMLEAIFKDMTLISIVGIQDPLRKGVREAVEVCQRAGAVVRMVTGDNLTTAKAIAADCGIFTPGGIVMEGPTFRKLTKKQMAQVIPSLQVLARSSPEDKRILVKRLKAFGETVAVTGDGTNDAPALKGADVGFSMGIAGTEVAKEASAIILMDDNFASIVKAMMWGRAVNDAVKKFLQFQITVNITAVVVTFITAVSSETEKSALTAVQLLWVNLIMDTMAALALATDPPTKSILEPQPKSAPLITFNMWKMIIGEAIYQLVITFTLYFGAARIFSHKTPPKDPLNLPEPVAETQLDGTLVFNTFIWMQIFNQWNNRRLDNKFNIFEGALNNYFLIGINAFSVERLDARGWGYSIAFGFLSIPIGAAIRCIPNYFLRSRDPPELTIEDAEEQITFLKPLADVREELSFLKKMKGGRINHLQFKVKQANDNFTSRSRSGSEANIAHDGTAEETTDRPTSTVESRKRRHAGRSRPKSASGATAVMAGIIADAGYEFQAAAESEGGCVASAAPSPESEGSKGSDKGARRHLRNEHSESGLVTDYRGWQISLGRRFMSLKIWFLMRTYGIDGMQEHIRRHVKLGKIFHSLPKERSNLFTIITGPSFALTVFNVKPKHGESLVEANRLSKEVYELVNRRGEIYITSGVVAGIYAIRVVGENPRAEEKYVRNAFNIIVKATVEVRDGNIANGVTGKLQQLVEEGGGRGLRETETNDSAAK